MAESCAQKSSADIGIGVTGTMGNIDPANPESSVPGKLFFAIYFKGETKSFCTELPPAPSRLMYKLTAADRILDELLKII